MALMIHQISNNLDETHTQLFVDDLCTPKNLCIPKND